MTNNKQSTRYYSNRQEKYVAKQLNGKTQPNSGATPFGLGDVTVGSDWLVECKTQMTSKKSMTIQKDWLDKLEEERFAMRKANKVLAFNFGPDEPIYYVLDEKTFKQMIRRNEDE